MSLRGRRPWMVACASVMGRRPRGLVVLLAVTGVVSACGGVGASGVAALRSGAGAAATPPPGVQLSPGPPVHHPGVALPDPRLTPGAVFSGVTLGQVCQRGYAGRERSVSITLKREVYRRYRIRYVPGRYVVDHLVPLEIGGANLGRDPHTGQVDPTANLWPQPASGTVGSHAKDGLENYLRRQVCARRVGLREAQLQIAHDWYAAWLRAGRPQP